MVEQLDGIEGRLDEGVGRLVKNEGEVRWLKWAVRGLGVAGGVAVALVGVVGGRL